MENNAKNVFERLDKQGEKIEDLSQKLEGISVNDLYALAKRTWDYGDFQAAQKYYNHISLLKPLDWEAPLYASLCNFRGYHNVLFWVKVPEQIEKIFISTIKYVNSLEMDNGKKEFEMSRCIGIITSEILNRKDHYFKYKKNYDAVDPNYIYALEDLFINFYNEIKNLELKANKDYLVILAENCLDLIKFTNKISPNITREAFEELTDCTFKDFDIDFDEIVEKNKSIIKHKNELSVEEKKKIMLKGVMYFEYNDKVISKRHFKNKLIISLSLISLSLIGFILSLILEVWFVLLFIFPCLVGLYVLVAAFTQKEKVKCKSLLSSQRKYNRLTSDGNIVTEDKVNVIKIILPIGISVYIVIAMFFFLLLLNSDLGFIFRITIELLTILNVIICFITFYKFYGENYSKFNGKYLYYYKGKYYKFD